MGRLSGSLVFQELLHGYFFIRQIFLNFIESKRRLKAANNEKSKMYYIVSRTTDFCNCKIIYRGWRLTAYIFFTGTR